MISSLKMDTDDIEAVAASLVREYLSRKGLKNTLQVLDDESPRVTTSINNRMDLMKALHIQSHMKKNKECGKPYKTMIEVMAKHYCEKGKGKTLPFEQEVPSNSKLSQKHGDLVIDDDIEGEMMLGEGKAGIFGKGEEGDMYNVGVLKPQANKAGRMRGMSGPVSSSIENPKQRKWKYGRPLSHDEEEKERTAIPAKQTASETRYKRSSFGEASIEEMLVGKSKDNTNIAIKDVLNVDDTLKKMKEQRRLMRAMKKEPDDDLSGYGYNVEKSSIANDEPSRCSTSTSRSSNEENAKQNEQSNRVNSAENKQLKPINSGEKTRKPKENEELGDVEDFETGFTDVAPSPKINIGKFSKQLQSEPIDLQTAIDIKLLLFGTTTRHFSDEWKYQGFTFSEVQRLRYGIVQKKGGSCGVLASVQAVLLQDLLFSQSRKASPSKLQPSAQQRSECLSKALATVLWRAGNHERAVVTVSTGRPQFQLSSKFKGDNFTETLMMYIFQNYDDLLLFIKQNNPQFELHGNNGVIHSLYSIILSRTVNRIKEDMDEKTGKLIGAHNYCSQELVNLYLTGHAVSNVFNDKIELDSGGGTNTILKGLTGRSNIGFLSLFEHYKSCQVGTYYKTPVYPIWVVCSESHFSVLFCLNKDLMNNWRAERRFDLYYYDGLANQDEEIRLTIDTTNKYFQPPKDDDLVPPIDQCIRTKWTDAEVDWNGTEPLL